MAVVRVAVREIRENTWRALLTAGFSAGEASVAADAVTTSEVCFGCGLDIVGNELAKVLEPGPASTPTRSAVDIEPGPPVRTLGLGHPGGLLSLAPLATGLIVAERDSKADRSPIRIPGRSWDPVLAGFLLCEVDQPYGQALDLVASELDAEGRFQRAVRVSRLGVAFWTAGVDHRPPLQWPADDRSPGVLIADVRFDGGFDDSFNAGAEPMPGPPDQTVSAEELSRRVGLAEENGVEVAAERWEPVDRAAKRYLVPDCT